MTLTIFIWFLTFLVIAISVNGIVKVFLIAKNYFIDKSHKSLIKEDSLNTDDEK